MHRYSFLFAILGFLTLALLGGAGDWVRLGLAWAAVNFIGVALAYARQRSGVFGKRPDGTMAKLNVFVFLPFLALTWVMWHAIRLLSREPPANRLGRDLILARRLLDGEIPEDVAVVVDLTAEFHEPIAMRRARKYLNFRILDADAPPFDILVEFMNEIPSSGTILIHCAQGHGRTAMIAACLLLKLGDATTADAAIKRILSERPRARMNRRQRALVEAYAAAQRS